MLSHEEISSKSTSEFCKTLILKTFVNGIGGYNLLACVEKFLSDVMAYREICM